MVHIQRFLVLGALIATLHSAIDAAEAQEPWQPFGAERGDTATRTSKSAHAKEAGNRPGPADARPLLEPFPMPDERAPAATAAPPAPGQARQDGHPPIVMRENVPAPVEQGELPPVMSNDGSGLPYELWRGLDAGTIESLLATLTIPPRSAALHDLWRRLITTEVAAPSGGEQNQKFTSLRLEALYRSGLMGEMSAELTKAGTDPLLALYAARAALAKGDDKAACEAHDMAPAANQLPKALKTDVLLLAGYCAAVAGDTAGAGLAADLSREEGLEQGVGLDALDAIAMAAKPNPQVPAHLSLVELKIVERAGFAPSPEMLAKAEPAALTALTNDPRTPPELRVAAAEAATRVNALPPDGLAAIYAATATKNPVDSLLSSSAASTPVRRAALFKAAEAERTPMRKTRLIRALIDAAKPAGLAFQVMRISARAASEIKPEPEVGWFAETAAEIGLAAGNYDLTRRWVAASAQATSNQGLGGEHSLSQWLALADIADANAGTTDAHLKDLEALALRSRFSPEALHRLATVLDALNYIVPIPLWEAASRNPQPAGGYLPATGVLTALKDAAKNHEFGRTVLLVMQTLGPDGAEGANILALGDSIRALKRAGLEADARRLGLEALLSAWPRTAVD